MYRTQHFPFSSTQKTISQTVDSVSEDKTETVNLSAGSDKRQYGTSGDTCCPMDPQKSCDEKHRNEGCDNSGYQADVDSVD